MHLVFPKFNGDVFTSVCYVTLLSCSGFVCLLYLQFHVQSNNLYTWAVRFYLKRSIYIKNRPTEFMVLKVESFGSSALQWPESLISGHWVTWVSKSEFLWHRWPSVTNHHLKAALISGPRGRPCRNCSPDTTQRDTFQGCRSTVGNTIHYEIFPTLTDGTRMFVFLLHVTWPLML